MSKTHYLKYLYLTTKLTKFLYIQHWYYEKGKYFVSVSPEPNYDFGYVFTYNVWELSNDDHYYLRLYKTNFRTHKDAYDQAAYDLLMKMTDSNGKI